MSSEKSQDDDVNAIVSRTKKFFEGDLQRTRTHTDRLFAALLVGQWLFGILISLVFSPYTWAGKIKVVNLHVWIALVLGGLIISFPIALVLKKPGAVTTRYVVAIAQMVYSALLIHLTGGRIETHFHVFGSLALLAFYLDLGLLVVAAVTIALDHFVRGLLWPESVYGITNPEWWRFLEHGFWVIFTTAALIVSCLRSLRGKRTTAEEGALREAMKVGEWQSILESERNKVEAK